MGFRISESNQCEKIERSIKKDMYQYMHEASKKTGWVHLAGLPIGIASGLLTIARRVGLIGENLLKGAINIAGSPFSPSCSFKKGCEQLFLNAPGHLLGLPFSLLSAATGLFTKTIWTFIAPTDYLYDKWCVHDPIEKAAKIERTRQEEPLLQDPPSSTFSAEQQEAMIRMRKRAQKAHDDDLIEMYGKEITDLQIIADGFKRILNGSGEEKHQYVAMYDHLLENTTFWERELKGKKAASANFDGDPENEELNAKKEEVTALKNEINTLAEQLGLV